jgi:hypothetical protein
MEFTQSKDNRLFPLRSHFQREQHIRGHRHQTSYKQANPQVWNPAVHQDRAEDCDYKQDTKDGSCHTRNVLVILAWLLLNSIPYIL